MAPRADLRPDLWWFLHFWDLFWHPFGILWAPLGRFGALGTQKNESLDHFCQQKETQGSPRTYQGHPKVVKRVHYPSASVKHYVFTHYYCEYQSSFFKCLSKTLRFYDVARVSLVFYWGTWTPGAHLDHFGAPMAPRADLRPHLWWFSSLLGPLLGPFWDPFGTLWAPLGRFWALGTQQ